MADRQALLTGWGRTAPSAAALTTVRTPDDVRRVLRDPPARGVGVRGLGRSYNDAAQNAGGVVLDMTGLDGAIELDPAAGTVTAPAGVSLDRLLHHLVPEGWFVPVSPGTRQVTLGGAVAADVHGKNHHRDGSIGRHVVSAELMTADGQVRSIGPAREPDLFWATTGGMGLTGVLLRVTLRVHPVGSSWMRVDTRRARDLDEAMHQLEDADDRHGYTVAWIDCLAGGRRLGRGVVTSGDHADPEDLPISARHAPLAFGSRTRLGLPPGVPGGLLRPETARAFNAVWYRKAPRHREAEPQPLASFFHPLDTVAGWNRVYGRRGLVQYQFVVPPDAAGAVRTVVEHLSKARAPAFLAVLKRFGPETPAPLSFPRRGWTLAVDLPAGLGRVGGLLDEADRLVAAAGGRVYLAKDSRVDPGLLDDMYPRLPEWRRVRAVVDPSNVFRSDLARRLSL